MLGDKSGIGVARQKRGMLRELLQKFEIGFDAKDIGFAQCALHAADRLGAIAAPGDELRDHRVIIDTDGVAGDDTGIEPHVAVAFGLRCRE